MIIDESPLNFEEWKIAYGVCDDCGVDIIRVDRDSWLDDKCHRHKFVRLVE